MNCTAVNERSIKQRCSTDTSGQELWQVSQLPLADFIQAADNIWLSGHFTGCVSDGCCLNGCGEYCVSYLKMDRVWALRQRDYK